MSKKLNINIRGFDVATVENAVKTIQQQLLQLKASKWKDLKSVSLPLPTKIREISFPSSPHKHKESSGKKFAQTIHNRLVQISNPPATILDYFRNLPASHNFEISIKLIGSSAK